MKIKEESETFINRFWLAIAFKGPTKHFVGIVDVVIKVVYVDAVVVVVVTAEVI